MNVFVGRLLEEVLGPVENGEDVRWYMCVDGEEEGSIAVNTLLWQ